VTRAEALAVAAAIIRASVPDLKTLLGLLENANHRRLAAEIRRQAVAPTVRIEGQPHCDPALWARGSVR
jgi:hypothetical protein